MPRWIVVAACAAASLACSSSGSVPVGDGGPRRDASAADSPGGNPNGCSAAGGQCQCAGGCAAGFHPAPMPLLGQCPQPCELCGACSTECCLPDDPADAGCEGAFNCLCGEPLCVGGTWQCGTCSG